MLANEAFSQCRWEGYDQIGVCLPKQLQLTGFKTGFVMAYQQDFQMSAISGIY